MGAGALLDEPRIFMDGLSDESGAAAPLAMAIKQLGAPVASEVAQLEAYVHSQLWTPERTFTVSFGRPSVRSQSALDARAYVHETLWTPEHGERRQFLQGRDYAVRASMVYWSDEFQAAPERARAAAPALTAECLKCWNACAKKTNCCNWMVCWSENRSLETWRAYNYPHVTAVYWSLYRLARHFSPPLASRASWHWYLLQAARTAAAMWVHGGKGSGTSQWGLMVGSVFERLLSDLERELEAAERQPAGTGTIGPWRKVPPDPQEVMLRTLHRRPMRAEGSCGPDAQLERDTDAKVDGDGVPVRLGVPLGLDRARGDPHLAAPRGPSRGRK